jgi:hypothetical protein
MKKNKRAEASASREPGLRLSLRRETLRNLASSDLAGVAGGHQPTLEPTNSKPH